MKTLTETTPFKFSGFLALVAHLALVALITKLTLDLVAAFSWGTVVALSGAFLLLVLTLAGYVVVNPNQAKALVFLGRYIGTIREQGFFWANPFTIKRKAQMVNNLLVVLTSEQESQPIINAGTLY